MDHYRFYELDHSDRIKAGRSVECRSDSDARRADLTLLERASKVEVWKSDVCLVHLPDDRLWDQLRGAWMTS